MSKWGRVTILDGCLQTCDVLPRRTPFNDSIRRQQPKKEGIEIKIQRQYAKTVCEDSIRRQYPKTVAKEGQYPNKDPKTISKEGQYPKTVAKEGQYPNAGSKDSMQRRTVSQDTIPKKGSIQGRIASKEVFLWSFILCLYLHLYLYFLLDGWM